MSSASSLQPSSLRKDILRVEGPDDMGVCIALLQYLNIGPRVNVKSSNGIDELLKALPVQLQESELGRLGIVVDADTSVQARWDALRHVLVKAQYKSVPKQPEGAGTILTENDLPTVGIWIMPDNQQAGALEDFACSLVPTNDKLWPFADTTLQQVINIERRFVSTHEQKARLHTWLAWQQEPGRPIGQSITKRFLDPKAPAAKPLYDWLQKLFAI